MSMDVSQLFLQMHEINQFVRRGVSLVHTCKGFKLYLPGLLALAAQHVTAKEGESFSTGLRNRERQGLGAQYPHL